MTFSCAASAEQKFPRNINPYFLGKYKNIFQNVICCCCDWHFKGHTRHPMGTTTSFEETNSEDLEQTVHAIWKGSLRFEDITNGPSLHSIMILNILTKLSKQTDQDQTDLTIWTMPCENVSSILAFPMHRLGLCSPFIHFAEQRPKRCIGNAQDDLNLQNLIIFKGTFSFGMAHIESTVLLSILTLVLLVRDMPCLCKQCRSRSVGFF